VAIILEMKNQFSLNREWQHGEFQRIQVVEEMFKKYFKWPFS
jgi:hypothetical protein